MPITVSAEDASFGLKIVYGILSAICGASAATFVLGIKLNKRDAANTKRDELILELQQDRDQLRIAKEIEKRDQAKFCKDRWDDLQKEQAKAIEQISKTICASVKLMISEIEKASAEKLTEMHINIGILLDRTNPDEELKKMLKAHLEQRHGVDRRVND